jgi:hypothetical protein
LIPDLVFRSPVRLRRYRSAPGIATVLLDRTGLRGERR